MSETSSEPDQCGTVYYAQSMPVDPSEPVYTAAIGESKQAAKEAVKQQTQKEYPLLIHNLTWDYDTVTFKDWRFTVKEHPLWSLPD